MLVQESRSCAENLTEAVRHAHLLLDTFLQLCQLHLQRFEGQVRLSDLLL